MGTAARREPLKQRVNRCLLKLSDRDTEAMAAAELEAIARALDPNELPAFVSAVSDARPTDKTPLRRHALRALALVAATHPRDVVAPLVPRILAAALRRVRDQDSSVRAALVDAARAAAAASGSASAALRPLTDALLHEQDQCAQLAAALATAAAVEASVLTADLASYLQKLQPRLLKLLRSNAFKAKPALITLIGASAAMGGAAEVTASIPCLRDAIASDDWAARKAAAEALAALALEHTDLLMTYKSSCVTFFEARRFDKVKIVRESMNRMIQVWKEIPDVEEDECSSAEPPASQSQCRSSLTGSASDGRYPAASLASNSVQSATRRSRLPVSRSPPPDVSPSVTKTSSPSSIRNKKLSPPSHRKVGQAKKCDYKVDIALALDATPIKVVTEEKLLKGGNVRARLDARRTHFQGSEGANKLTGSKAGSRVVPYEGGGNLEEISEVDGGSERFQSVHKDERFSEIKTQLRQIENQQSSLLDLLQKFMGNSESGMNSLETRVHGLEMALDEITRDLAFSSGRMSNREPDVNTCCILSPNFWRRRDGGRYSSRYSVSDAPNSSEEGRTSYKWERRKFGLRGGLVTNPLAEPNMSSVGKTRVTQEGRRKDTTLQKSRMG
ncbi:TORTIFOLIA1-like protein 3 isoform X2 [Phragmites australis]|uniref:TORTIFOLIA1-like protein 3 isoform X2 n=1 Tax=Phragmites australis TaxID=29695 RepID=UPI002D771A10|nr:TORTIFOLIA1-like protein 3 isoform X2 [Phragmites australis]